MTTSTFHIRPRFTLSNPHTVGEISRVFKKALSTPEAPFDGKVKFGFLDVHPKVEDHHYWSPHLSAIIEEDEDNPNTTLIRGMYGPSPTVWSLFIFIYAIIFFAILIIIIIGFSARSVGESSSILWLLPILFLMLSSIYLVSYFGQRKGHDQIEAIDYWFNTVLKSMD